MPIKVKESATLFSLDSFNTDLDQWIDSNAQPKLQDLFSHLYDAYWLQLEQERGALLETCDEGTQCRLLLEQDMKTRIQNQYLDALASFKKDISASLLLSQ